jgi:hypothetical protein
MQTDGQTSMAKQIYVIFLKLSTANVPDYEHQWGMYLIGQILSGNLIIFWTRVSNIIDSYYDKYLLDPLVAPLKAWYCGRSLAGIESSSPAGNMDVSFVFRRADHSS